jgi:hypothetical protein
MIIIEECVVGVDPPPPPPIDRPCTIDSSTLAGRDEYSTDYCKRAGKALLAAFPIYAPNHRLESSTGTGVGRWVWVNRTYLL